MNSSLYALSLLQSQKILPLYFHPDETVSLRVLQSLYEAGIRSVEYTNRGSRALGNFRCLVREKKHSMPDLQLGAGTVKTLEEARAFAEAGADFVVCPCMIEEVGRFVLSAELLWIPGCMTSTEITRAEQTGAQLVKIFPGSLLGPSYIRALKDIFPDLYFMPTGGVEINRENLTAWFQAGVTAVGLGSKLISPTILDNQAYGQLKDLTGTALEIVRSIH